MSKAAMFPIANPYPEWTSGRPMDFCRPIRDTLSTKQNIYCGHIQNGNTHVHNPRQRRHIPNLFHGWKEPAHTWGGGTERNEEGGGQVEGALRGVQRSPTSSSAGITKLLEHKLLQRLVHVENSFHLKRKRRRSQEVTAEEIKAFKERPCFALMIILNLSSVRQWNQLKIN